MEDINKKLELMHRKYVSVNGEIGSMRLFNNEILVYCRKKLTKEKISKLKEEASPFNLILKKINE